VRSKLSSVSLKLSLALNAAFLIGACASDLKGTPVWNGKLWAGNPAAGEIWRTQHDLRGPILHVLLVREQLPVLVNAHSLLPGREQCGD